MKSKIAELDGVRGIAILLVLVCHISLWEPFSAARPVLFHGTIGVDLFFVLSGFLITGMLLDSREREGATGNFYLRRILRIWPVYFIALFGLFAFLRRFLPASVTPLHYVFFIQNLSPNQSDGPMLHPFWSLAVEEQFYLIWPWVALRLSPKALTRLCVMLFVSALAIRILLTRLGVSEQIVYVNTFCRMDGIALGSLLAVWIRNGKSTPRIRAGYAVAMACALAICLRAEVHTTLRQFGDSFAAIVFAWLVLTAWEQRGSDKVLARFLRKRILTYVGQISFTLYIVNLPIFTLAHGNALNGLFGAAQHPVRAGLLLTILGAGVSLLVAACSWKFLESPILQLKAKLSAPRAVPTFATGD